MATGLPILPSTVSDDQRQKMMQTVSTLGGTTQPQQANQVRSVATAPLSAPTANGALNRPDAPSYDPFSRPGDGYGDSQMRAAQYEGMLRDAASQKGFGASKRSAAMLGAAQGMLAPGLNQVQAQSQDYQSQLKAYDAAMQGGYGGSAPPVGGDTAGLINSLSQIFGQQTTPSDPTAPADTNAPTAPAIPAATPDAPATPAVASALPTTDPYGNDNMLANSMNATADRMKKTRLSGGIMS